MQKYFNQNHQIYFLQDVFIHGGPSLMNINWELTEYFNPIEIQKEK